MLDRFISVAQRGSWSSGGGGGGVLCLSFLSCRVIQRLDSHNLSTEDKAKIFLLLLLPLLLLPVFLPSRYLLFSDEHHAWPLVLLRRRAEMLLLCVTDVYLFKSLNELVTAERWRRWR